MGERWREKYWVREKNKWVKRDSEGSDGDSVCGETMREKQ